MHSLTISFNMLVRYLTYMYVYLTVIDFIMLLYSKVYLHSLHDIHGIMSIIYKQVIEVNIVLK